MIVIIDVQGRRHSTTCLRIQKISHDKAEGKMEAGVIRNLFFQPDGLRNNWL
jgi:hypothetical protein